MTTRTAIAAVAALTALACADTTAPLPGPQALAVGASTAGTGGMTDLGTLGGNSSQAFGINAESQIIGVSRTASGSSRGAVWDGVTRVPTALGTLPEGTGSAAMGINDQGDVVGSGTTSDDQQAPNHAILWPAATRTPTDLGTLGEGRDSWATGINNSGQVVGAGNTSWDWKRSPKHAILWDDATQPPTDLGTLGGRDSEATGINDEGDVVGYSYTSGGQMHAFRWTSLDGMQDLGTLGGGSAMAWAINDRGQIVGSSSTADGSRHAFLWTSAGMRDLGTLGGASSDAYAINELGHVVGMSYTTNDAEFHAFLWTEDAGMKDLGTLGGGFSYAHGIADDGTVVGYSYTSTGAMHAFIWSLPVAIIIKPDVTSGVAVIRPSSRGAVAVTILGNAVLDVTTVDVTTLRFGPAGATPTHDLTKPNVYAEHLQDVNLDGLVDLVVHFRQRDTGLRSGDTEACITARTGAGLRVASCAAVTVR